MPLLRLHTNLALEDALARTYLERASNLVSTHLKKDPKFFMGAIEGPKSMLFAETGAPLGLLELEALELPAELTSELSRDLCDLTAELLSIPTERIYVKFQDVRRGMWGWNGRVF